MFNQFLLSRWHGFRLCILMLSLPASSFLPTAQADEVKPPNVLLITLDDMNRDSIGVYGAKVPDATPNIDQLAADGLRFEHAHVTIAICQPTRAVWMTGRYPHNNGALGFNHIRPDVPTLPETLARHGYLTGILGKTEHVVPSRPEAFHYRRTRAELQNGRSQNLYGRFTGEFLDHVNVSERPFFLMVNTHDPHRPFDNRKAVAKRRPLTVTKKKNKRGRTVTSYQGDYPAPSKIYSPGDVPVPGFLPDLPAIREEIAQYYSSVRRADDVVGRVLKELDTAGLRENTVVMLKSDHGIAVPFAKTNVYRHSTLTPWIIRWPNKIQPGTVDGHHFVSGIDLAPTVLEIAGLPPLEGSDGQSFLPLLKGKTQPRRDVVFTHINTIASGRDYAMRSVQTKRHGLIWNGWCNGTTEFRNESMSGLTWKAMLNAAETDPAIAERVALFRHRVPFEFYDYQSDPDARRNLIDDPQYTEIVEELIDRMNQLMSDSNDPQARSFRTAVQQRADATEAPVSR